MRLAHACLAIGLIAGSERLSAQSNTISLTTLGTLTISVATPGGQPVPSSSTGRYSVNVVSGRVKITAQLDTPLPSGVTLTVTLTAPTGGISLGGVVLGTSSQDVVRYIPIGEYPSLSLSLALNSSVSAGVVPYNTSHIVLTLVDDP
jgi:hypothetical protein